MQFSQREYWVWHGKYHVTKNTLRLIQRNMLHSDCAWAALDRFYKAIAVASCAFWAALAFSRKKLCKCYAYGVALHTKYIAGERNTAAQIGQHLSAVTSHCLTVCCAYGATTWAFKHKQLTQKWMRKIRQWALSKNDLNTKNKRRQTAFILREIYQVAQIGQQTLEVAQMGQLQVEKSVELVKERCLNWHWFYSSYSTRASFDERVQ